MIKFYFLITGLAITVLTFACNPDSKAQKNASPKGYNLVQPDDKITFNELLDEISGIAFYPDGKKLAAINDEEGYLFTIDLQTKKQTKVLSLVNRAIMKISAMLMVFGMC